ncbi:MAG: hypothetical protein RLZ25_805 [Pseudomonadota bacterium]|jgi:hypothetical protein
MECSPWGLNLWYGPAALQTMTILHSSSRFQITPIRYIEFQKNSHLDLEPVIQSSSNNIRIYIGTCLS